MNNLGVYVSSNHLVFKNGKVFTINRNRYQKPSYSISRDGERYLKVRIGKNKRQYLHRLVYWAFTAQDLNKLEVDHLNMNTLDCSLDNLRLVTSKENKISRDIKRDFKIIYKTNSKTVIFKGEN